MVGGVKGAILSLCQSDSEAGKAERERADHARERQLEHQREQLQSEFSAATEEIAAGKERAWAQLGGAVVGVVCSFAGAAFKLGEVGAKVVQGVGSASGSAGGGIGGLLAADNNRRAADYTAAAKQDGVTATEYQAIAEEAGASRSEARDRARQRFQQALQQLSDLDQVGRIEGG